MTVAAGGAPSGTGGAHSGYFFLKYAQTVPLRTPGSTTMYLESVSTSRIRSILDMSSSIPLGDMSGEANPPLSPPATGVTGIMFSFASMSTFCTSSTFFGRTITSAGMDSSPMIPFET